MTSKVNNIANAIVKSCGSEVRFTPSLLTGSVEERQEGIRSLQTAVIHKKANPWREATDVNGVNYVANGGLSSEYKAMLLNAYALFRMGQLPYAPTIGTLKGAQEYLQHVTDVCNTMMNGVRYKTLAQADHVRATATICAEVRIRSKHQAVFTKTDHGQELKELIEEQMADMEDGSLGDIEEDVNDLTAELSHMQILRELDSAIDSHSRMSNDEGWLVVALHDHAQLFNAEEWVIRDIAGMEARLSRSLINLKELALPTHHPLWGTLVEERLPKAWASARSYLKEQAALELKNELLEARALAKKRGVAKDRLPSRVAKEAIKERWETLQKQFDKKTEKRRLVLTEGLLAQMPAELRAGQPGQYARWALSHAARRVWRDLVTLDQMKERLEKRHDYILRREMEEEKYNVDNPVWARSLVYDENDPLEGRDRTWLLAGYKEVTEVDVLLSSPEDHYKLENRGTHHISKELAFGPATIIDCVGLNGKVISSKTYWFNQKVVEKTQRSTDWKAADIRQEVFTAKKEVVKLGDRRMVVQQKLSVVNTAGELERLILRGVTNSIEELQGDLRGLHSEIREVELALAPVWKVLWDEEKEEKGHDPVMPDHPPLYWDHKGAYQTQEEALEAVKAASEQPDAALLQIRGDDMLEKMQALTKGTAFMLG